MSAIRVFDPACGSGNFLVVAYRELRAREIRILRRLGDLEGQTQIQMWSQIPITNFYGIEITDFSAETAKLAMFIAEYQANTTFDEAFGRKPAALPLKGGANIRNENALRISWDDVCSPMKGGEVFIAGNPPFLGSTYQSKDQKADLAKVFDGHVKSYAAFDFVAAWFFKASGYIRNTKARAAFVSTNSICQGYSVAALWPHILKDELEIFFANKDFKWRNNAAANAAVICSVIGIRPKVRDRKRLFDDGVSTDADNINPYLANAPTVYVEGIRKGLFGLPQMDYGNKPVEGGHLIIDHAEKTTLERENPDAAKFLRPFMGSQEVTKGFQRYCFWITAENLAQARLIPEIEKVRAESTDAYVREKLLPLSYRFKQVFEARNHMFIVPRHTGENRRYLPCERVSSEVICSDAAMALYDAPDWSFAIFSSRLHMVWIAAVCGKIKSDYRYSNTLGWNTFPVPVFTGSQLEALSLSARTILKTRYKHHPATIADLYDPEKMPEDLREAHRANDELLESMYIGRPFKTDTERLEHLFKLYAAKVKKLKKEAA